MADKKFSDLVEDTAPTANDLVATTDLETGQSRKVKLTNLVRGFVGAITNDLFSTSAGQLAGPWETWTPSLATGAFGTGGTIAGQKRQVGKTVHARFKGTVGSGGWSMGISVVPPVAAVTAVKGTTIGTVLYEDAGVNYYGGFVICDPTTGNFIPAGISNGSNGIIGIGTNSYPFVYGAGDKVSFTVVYEAA